MPSVVAPARRDAGLAPSTQERAPRRCQVVRAFELQRRWRHPKAVVLLSNWRVDPLEDVVNVEENFENIPWECEGVNGGVMPSHRLEVGLRPNPLLEFVVLGHSTAPFMPPPTCPHPLVPLHSPAYARPHRSRP